MNVAGIIRRVSVRILITPRSAPAVLKSSRRIVINEIKKSFLLSVHLSLDYTGSAEQILDSQIYFSLPGGDGHSWFF